MRELVFLLFVLLLSPLSQSAEMLETVWERRMVKGVDSIQIMDFGNDGVNEIYASSLDPVRPAVSVLYPNGSLMWETTISRYNVHSYPSEEIKLIHVSDLDGDDNLDILAASEVHSGAANIHPLYMVERESREGSEGIYNRLKWTSQASGPITSINVGDMDYDRASEIVLSSSDYNVYVLDPEGNLEKKYYVGKSVWDVSLANLDSDEMLEMVLGTFQGTCLLDNWSVRWEYPAEDRVLRVTATDLEGDGKKEIIASSEYKLMAFNPMSELLWREDIPGLTSNIQLVDLENDGVMEILLGTAGGLIVFDNEGNRKWNYAIEERISALAVIDTDNDGTPELMVGTNKRLVAFRMNEIFMKEEKAKVYLEKARDSRAAGELHDALEYIRLSNVLYVELNYTDGMLETGSLSEQYGNDVAYADRLAEADSYLNKSRYAYRTGDYNGTLTYAEMAGEIYSALDYTAGLGELDLLLNSFESKKQADAYIGEARSAYVQSDFKTALEKAEKAREIYRELNDTAGLLEAEPVIRLSEDKISSIGEATTILLTTIKPETDGRRINTPYTVPLIAAALVAVLLILMKSGRRKRKSQESPTGPKAEQRPAGKS